MGRHNVSGNHCLLIIPHIVPHCCFWEHVKDHFRNCGNPLGTFKTWEPFENMVGTFSKHRNPQKKIIIVFKINFQTIPKNKLKLTLA
jgi:hypothetical protein